MAARRVHRTAAILALAVALGCSQTLDERIPVPPGGRLVIALPLGDVKVESHDADEVRIELEADGLNAPALSFDLSHVGDEVALRGELASFRIRLFEALRVDVHARVPRSFDVDLETGSGELRASRLTGELRLESRSGPVQAESVTGRLEAKTRSGNMWVDKLRGEALLVSRSGSIRVRDAEGALEAESRHGSIEARKIRGTLWAEGRNGAIEVVAVKGNVEAQTRAGSIRIQAVAGAVDAETRSGSLFVSFATAPAGHLRTRSGGIEVRIPPGEGVDLAARTRRGRVHVSQSFGVHPTGRDRLTARIHGGGHSLRLETDRADIRVEPAAAVATW